MKQTLAEYTGKALHYEVDHARDEYSRALSRREDAEFERGVVFGIERAMKVMRKCQDFWIAEGDDMPTLPVFKESVNMGGDEHIYLNDARYADFIHSVYEVLQKDTSIETVMRVVDLSLAYEYDCAMAHIVDKPRKWLYSEIDTES